MYLLDTNICIAILKANPLAIARFQDKYQYCCLPTLVIAELYKGVYCSSRVQDNLRTVTQFINEFPQISFDKLAAMEFGKVQGELRKIGKSTGEIDALIAAIARSRQNILVTNNLRHFESIANLQLENWLSNTT